MPEGKKFTEELLPPMPDGLSIKPLTLQTICDLDLSPFFEVNGRTVVTLSPEVVGLFPQLLPIMEWVLESIKRVLEEQHKLDEKPDNETKSRELARFVDQLVRTLNERITVAVANVVFRNRCTDSPNLFAWLANKEIVDDEEFRLMARKTIKTLIEMKVVGSQSRLAQDCGINRGQLCSFLGNCGPLGMEKIVKCLKFALAEAEKLGRLDELKNLLEEE